MKEKRKVLFKLNNSPLTLILTHEDANALKKLAETVMYEVNSMEKEEVLSDIDTYLTSENLDGRVLWFYKDDENELEAIGIDEIIELKNYTKKKHTCVSLNCPFVNHCKDYNFLIDRGDACEIHTWFLEKVQKYLSEKERKQ